MKVLYELSSFTQDAAHEDILLTAFAAFVGLWVFEGLAYIIYSFIGGEIFGPIKYRRILARHTMDFAAMIAFSILGMQAIAEMGGWESFATLSHPADGSIVSVGVARSYFHHPIGFVVCLLQVAYEAKNFCDSVIHNDGLLFLAHHVSTGYLAYQGTLGIFHQYGAFFLGASEVSTAVLCVLACFDEEHGVAPLGKAFPTLMKLLGGAFAVLFVVFRVLLWPWVSYYFWLDAIEMVSTETARSSFVVWVFMICNAGLSILQVVWLGEILSTAVKILKGEGLSISRGSSEEQTKESASAAETDSADASKADNKTVKKSIGVSSSRKPAAADGSGMKLRSSSRISSRRARSSRGEEP